MGELGHDHDHRLEIHADVKVGRAGEVLLEVDGLVDLEATGGEQQAEEGNDRFFHRITTFTSLPGT
jgi:hypothetical protein